MTLRLIEGGRGNDRRAGAPGPRRRAGRDARRRPAPRRRPGATPRSSTRRRSAARVAGRAGRRVLGGPDRRRRAARRRRARPRGRRLRAGAVRAARRGRRRGDARARRPAHPPAVRGHARAGAGPAPARRRLPRDPRRRRRHPVDRRETRAADPSRPRRATAAAGSTRCCAHGVTTVEAKSGYGLDLATELRLLDVAWQLGREGPVDVVPTFLGAHAVPPEFRAQPGRHRGLRAAASSRSSCRASPPRAARARATCSASRACSRPTRAGGSSQAAAGYGMALRLHADELAPSGGAELAAELGALSADHLHTPSDEGVAALARGGRRRPPDGRDAAAGHDLVPDGGRGRRPRGGSSTPGCPVALGTDFNPGTSPDAEPAAGDDRRAASR